MASTSFNAATSSLHANGAPYLHYLEILNTKGFSWVEAKYATVISWVALMAHLSHSIRIPLSQHTLQEYWKFLFDWWSEQASY